MPYCANSGCHDGNFEPGSGPLHMFSIYNDAYNKEVVRVDHNGVTHRIPYQRSTISIEESFEAVHAANIYQEAETKDIALGTYTHDAGTPDDTSDDVPDAQYFTNRTAKETCQGNSDYAGGDFVNTSYASGATTCFRGNVFTFDITLHNIKLSLLPNIWSMFFCVNRLSVPFILISLLFLIPIILKSCFRSSFYSSCFEKTIIMPTNKVTFDLLHSIQSYTYCDYNACSTKENSKTIIDITIFLKNKG